MLRNVPIGNLQLHEIDPARRWTEGELAFVSAVMDQVAQTAENLRLLDEATERASREQLISQISDRLRRASDLETLMKIGVEELSRVLRPARTYVQFGSEEELGLAENSGEVDLDPAVAEPVVRLTTPSLSDPDEPEPTDFQFGQGDSDDE
jgi:GAF domain-containing protein